MNDVFRLSKRQKKMLVDFRQMCINEASRYMSDEAEYFKNISDTELLLYALCFAVERKRRTLQTYMR